MVEGWTRPDDEADVCPSYDGLVDQRVWGRVSESGEGGVGDGPKVGVSTKPEVFLAKYTMVDARRA